MFLRNLALASTATFVVVSSRPYGHLVNRQVSTDSAILSGQTFDYVIIGTAGLAVANRLSANSGVSVAVIEAGGDGADVMDRILAPTMAYLNGVASPGSAYDWGYETTPQTGLENRNVTWPRGKVLGGSSAVNGLYLVRAGKEEHDAWAALNPGSAGTWDWDGLWPYQKASETFTPPSSANVQTMAAVVDAPAHGQDGPIHYSYPGYAYEQIGLWSPTFAALGIPSRDGQTGKNYDSFIATSCINPSNWTRSYAKTGYLDPVAERTNLAVLTGYQATKINFEGKDAAGNATATSVDFAATAAGTVYNVKARREVILSSGVIGSPQLLQLSGVGDADLLKSLNIDVVVDLPGVGAHLKDHLSGRVMFNTSAEVTGDMLAYNATFNATQWQAWENRDANSLYNAPNNAIAYINASMVMGADYDSWHASIVSNKAKFVSAYSTNPILQAGYEAVYDSEMNTIIPGPTGAVEFLLSNSGSGAERNTLGIQAAIQHPLTQGSLKITSTSAFDAPLMDPGYLQHPADMQLFVAAFKFIRQLAKTAPLSSIIEGEITPGQDVTSDAALEDFIRGSVGTEYHPAATCSMLPREKGGVVNTQLQVYGLSNVRVIDSSIVPVPISAHLMAPTYAIAELGSAIMLGTHKVASSSSNNSSSTSSSSASTSSSTNGARSGANSAGMKIAPACGLAVLAAVLAIASI